VQKRGAEIIEARGFSSAASAANAAISHMRDWFKGHSHEWVSFGAWSTGNPYHIPDGLYFSFPVTFTNKNWEIVKGLQISPEQKARLDKTAEELVEERKAIESLLKI
jgi:malate dehydrogenase